MEVEGTAWCRAHRENWRKYMLMMIQLTIFIYFLSERLHFYINKKVREEEEEEEELNWEV